MFNKIHLSALTVVGAAVIAILPATGAAQQSLTVASWGGAYTNSQVEAYHKPFTAKTGIKITSADWGGTLRNQRTGEIRQRQVGRRRPGSR